MFTVATTCMVLVFLRVVNTCDFTYIVTNNGNVRKFIGGAELSDEAAYLEIYATDENSISMRYTLPNETIGVLKNIEVRWCENGILCRCKFVISTITKCLLFPAKYCVDIKNLVKNSKYMLNVGLMNDLRSIYWLEKEVVIKILEGIPGKIKKPISTVFDCSDATSCHLNISWNHPYNQNGSITAFNIILNSSETINNVTDFKTIHEIIKIDNKSYLPQYHYQIKYVPYRKKYNLYIQSENLKYKSDFTIVEVINNRNEALVNINENPVLLTTTEDSFIFKLPNFLNNMPFEATIIVQDYDKSQKVEINEFKTKKLCLNYGNTWIAKKSVVKTGRDYIVAISQDMAGKNRLIPNTKYCISFLIINLMENVEHDMFLENLELLHYDDSEPKLNVYQYILIVSFVLGTIFVVVRYLKKRKLTRKQDRKRVLSNESELIKLNGLTINNENVIEKTIRPSIPIPDLHQKDEPKEHEYEDIENNYNAYDHLNCI